MSLCAAPYQRKSLTACLPRNERLFILHSYNTTTVSAAPSAVIARVAFNVRARSLFDYHLLPQTASGTIDGCRVLAPFGNKNSVGIVMETATTTDVPVEKLKSLTQVYDDMPPLPPPTLALIRFCADYYHCPIGIAAAAVLPAFFRRDNRYSPPTGYRLNDSPAAADTTPRGKATEILSLLGDVANRGGMTTAQIRQQVENPTAALKKLLQSGRIVRFPLWEAADASPPPPSAVPHALTAAQQQALRELRLGDGFVPHLLFGATGSGKTEVYFRAVADTLARGRQALVLTPEIHLTPQLEKEFRCRFPDKRLCILHSGLADGERAHRWLMACSGVADIIVGTRLAVFTPLPRLGLIVVDEEHDDSYKQEEGLLFSARDVAVWRAKNENTPYLACSATPSLESYHNVQRKQWRCLMLPQRVNQKPPLIETVAMDDKGGFHGVGDALLRALSAHLNGGGQALIFINRRGYAPAVLCRGCAATVGCDHCSANMTLHRRRDQLCCHLCGAVAAVPLCCQHCGGKLTFQGIGTQRVEEALTRLFPDVPSLRMDSDSMQRGRFAAAYDDIAAGKIRLIIGTQLIAKGHNFPKLSLIGVLNADHGLAVTDFRGEERLFATLSQVIGRGTRNAEGCRVLLQTRQPQHPCYANIIADDVRGYWQRQIKKRERAVLPPFSHLAMLRGKDVSLPRLEKLMDAAAAAAVLHAEPGVRVFDAVPPPVEKVGGKHRRQMLVLSRRRDLLHKFLNRWLPALPSSGWNVDVDPISV